jgi:hypothetical protein
MRGISRSRRGPASWIVLAALACGGRATTPGKGAVGPEAARVIPLAQAIVLETAGPPPADTSVTFMAGQLHTIVLRHGPPDNLVFAELTFPPAAFADSGREVQVDIKPRPGLYGLDIRTSMPLRRPADLVFKYARYFLSPAKARSVYGNDVEFERALSVGQVLPNGQLALLPSTRPASDNLRAAVTTAGSYLVAAAQ